ncbi:hypothetical protein BJ138DRAFT_1151080 [Hygrophoropsis aurantiaca]|uniref:Uncharacterized protein n=2 Tax=Hygrophoropsis aurantiaca TaxID=72124 RepID=A0ACB8AD39_9AGAM|nr:hypothetical protein BJ138DRAFT_1151343 [Hygrophoropsis aurantiaca]KAH7911248.1 hypothetical protein BJ138DRAFT_1151080 [Hygrophoropsis aurantiaca]
MSASPDLQLDLNIDLNNTYGALFIGFTIASVLFGLTNVQTFLYFQTHRGITFYKIAICYLWILDAMHLAFIAHMIYHYLVNNYANPLVLPYIVWSFQAHIVVDVLIIYAVHLLYVQRLWILSRGRSKILPSIMTFIVVVGSSVAISLIWAVYQIHVFLDFIIIEWSAFLSLSVTCFVDMSIAGSMCYLLYTARTGFVKTDTLISKLISYSLNSGVLTSLCSLCVIMIYAIMPKNFVFLGVDFLAAKLYVNAYLALSNARYYLSTNENRNFPRQADDHGVQINPAPYSERTLVSNDEMSMEAGLISTIQPPPETLKPLIPNRLPVQYHSPTPSRGDSRWWTFRSASAGAESF